MSLPTIEELPISTGHDREERTERSDELKLEPVRGAVLVSLDEAESLSVTGRFGVAGPVPAGACDDSAAAGPPAGALP